MRPKDPRIRWGVLGWARIARNEAIPAIRRSSNGAFHALASRDAAKLAECQAKFNPPRLHGSYDELVRDPEVGAIYNPLPNSLHKEWTIKAAEHGKHVLCEKPIALNAAECREMIAACRANGAVLMEAFMYRYSACILKVRELLRSGRLGEIKFIQSQFRFLLDRAGDVRWVAGLGGGSLYDVGSYPVNFIGMVMDETTQSPPGEGPRAEPISVQCVKKNGVDESLSALVRYPGGVVAALHSGFNAQLRAFFRDHRHEGLARDPRYVLWRGWEHHSNHRRQAPRNPGARKRPLPVAGRGLCRCDPGQAPTVDHGGRNPEERGTPRPALRRGPVVVSSAEARPCGSARRAIPRDPRGALTCFHQNQTPARR